MKFQYVQDRIMTNDLRSEYNLALAIGLADRAGHGCDLNMETIQKLDKQAQGPLLKPLASVLVTSGRSRDDISRFAICGSTNNIQACPSKIFSQHKVF